MNKCLRCIKDLIFANMCAKLQCIAMLSAFFLPISLIWLGEDIKIKVIGKVDEFIQINVDGLSADATAVLAGICLSTLLCVHFRKGNKDYLLNKGNEYKYGCLLWYQFCASVLGYRKCDLRRVPVSQQIRLILDDTFEEFVYGDISDNLAIEIEARWLNENNSGMGNAINLMIADTYSLKREQITTGADLPTLIIKRKDCLNEGQRYYIPSLCNKVLEEINGLDKKITEINLYVATNPKHIIEITENVFKKGGRGNIKKICVYQQKSTGARLFRKKGRDIDV